MFFFLLVFAVYIVVLSVYVTTSYTLVVIIKNSM